jgi:hypothetical protein
VPKLRAKHRQDAVLPLVVLHTFRFVGLSFLGRVDGFSQV